jgi:hypothetical protein
VAIRGFAGDTREGGGGPRGASEEVRREKWLSVGKSLRRADGGEDNSGPSDSRESEEPLLQ